MPWIDASVPGPGLRPHRAAVPACLHGGIGDAELRALGLHRADVLDFSASTNPLGPSPRVAEVLTEFAAGGDLARYPDDGCPRLREALAAHTGYPPDQLIVANGSVEILWLLALAYLGPGDRVLVVGPTFGEYARAARIAGAAVVEWRAAEARAFRPDPDALAAAIRRTCPRLVFLCNPNNPTGVLLDRAVVTRLLSALSERLLVVDEAYAAFADDAPRLGLLLGDERLVLLRSLTKDYGLAGLRLGYALGASTVIAALDRVRPPWNVNAAAEVAGLAALADGAHLASAREEVVTVRAYLVDALRHLGLRVYAPAANFLLVDVGGTPVGDGQSFRSALLHYGIWVRDCASFGLPSCVRIGVRTRPRCARLVAAAAEVLAHA